MASNYTTNYQLNQWEAGDQVLRTEFNQDNQKIDTALKSNAEAITALESAAAGFGNCQIGYLTYIGNGISNGDASVSITFPKPPLLFLIRCDDGIALGTRQSDKFTFILLGPTTTNAGSSDISWSGNTARLSVWSYMSAMNESGQIYEVYALYDLDS